MNMYDLNDKFLKSYVLNFVSDQYMVYVGDMIDFMSSESGGSGYL